MKLLFLLLSLLILSSCSSPLVHVKNDLEHYKFDLAMKKLQNVKKIYGRNFSDLYAPMSATLNTDQTKQMLKLISLKGGDKHTVDKHNNTLLDYALKHKNIPLIKYFIEKGQKPKNVDALFDFAIQEKDLDLCDFLFSHKYHYSKVSQAYENSLSQHDFKAASYWLSHGASINNDPLILREAIANDNKSKVNFLLDNNYNFKEDKQLLTTIILNKNLKYLPIIIAAGFDVNSDKNLLSQVLLQPDYPLAEYLIENGADITLDKNLFDKALTKKDLTLMRYLIEHKVPAPSFTSVHLQRALEAESYDFIALLLDIDVTLNNGRTPLSHAAFLHKEKLIDFLLDRGADINEADTFGRTPIMYLVDNIKLTNKLISKGANLNVKDLQGRTPLMYAVNFFDVAKALIAHEADIHLKDNHDYSILTYAISNNQMPLVKLLVEEKNVPLNEVDRMGKRPLNFSSNMKMTRYLMKHKARR